MHQGGLFQRSQPEAPKLEPIVPFYGNGAWVGGDKGGPLGPEVEDAAMLPDKVLGYEPKHRNMLPSGQSSSAFT